MDDLETLVQTASRGELSAFVELTRRFRHFALGSALALLGDFHQAEDAVQEAFLAAWSALPSLADPAAFPGWFRGIIRHHAFRVIRRKHLETVPLEAANDTPSEQMLPDDRLDQREHIAAALPTIAELPPTLREPAMLFYIHECSHQDVTTFLGISVTTVNNPLAAARSKLKGRGLTMVTETLHAHRLPDDFANRVGRLIETRGNVIEVLFDPNALPDLLTELAISDEANRRPVAVQVIQRPGGGIVRGVVASPIESVPRGASVLNTQRHTAMPISRHAFTNAVQLLAGHTPEVSRQLETGIKAIDVMCPLIAGGTVAIAGELGAGTTVVMEELVRRLSGGADRVFLFTLAPQWEAERDPNYSHAELLKKDGFRVRLKLQPGVASSCQDVA